MAIISFSHVSKHYPGDIKALSDVTVSVNEGDMVFLAGPSGAGKSTLLKLIAGIERPSGGVLIVSGQDMRKLNRTTLPFLRRKLGLILQQHRLLHDRSVLANVMLPLIVSGALHQEAEQRARVALELVGLADKAAMIPLGLSGGEQQRVSIARAIVHQPRIILADEPTANLDRDSGRLVLEMLHAFNAAGTTCVISTHDERLLERATRVVQLEQGRLAAVREAESGVGL
ncbi:MAG: Cell division transporter, ATP-binding protein [Pseudomonadota bacterium]|jgi:cell division transport system ATP-binding protein